MMSPSDFSADRKGVCRAAPRRCHRYAMDDATSIATSDNRSSVGAQSVLARDWTVTAHEVCYATGEGKLLLDEVTAVIPGSSACALVGPSVADKGALLRLLGGAARGGYGHAARTHKALRCGDSL